MKFLVIVCLQLALGIGALNAQDYSIPQNIILVGRINRAGMMQKEWARGYARGLSDRRAGRSYNDADPLAISKKLPTSESYRSGYYRGYHQGH